VEIGDWVEVNDGSFDRGLRGRVCEIDAYGARIKATNRAEVKYTNSGEALASYENPAGQHFLFSQLKPLDAVTILAELNRGAPGGAGARLRGWLRRACAFVARRGSSGRASRPR